MKIRCLSILFVAIALSVFSGCSKDFLKSYNKRIIGEWELYGINKLGFGSSRIVFDEGYFIFREDGTLIYKPHDATEYEGTWRIRKSQQQTNSENGVSSNTIHNLIISVVNKNDRTDILTESFNDMTFTGTNRFNAIVENQNNQVTYKFKR
ncbi:MAG: hypothetical protein QM727_06130 [Niabella sp.]